MAVLLQLVLATKVHARVSQWARLGFYSVRYRRPSQMLTSLTQRM
jgi:hypothetical protein